MKNKKRITLPALNSGPTGDAGMAIVQEVVSNEVPPGLGWIFRPLPTSDYGIDGQIETVRTTSSGRSPTGRIVSVQVKTGPSYFAKDQKDHWRVLVRKQTVAYWRAHSVPVVLIIVDPVKRECFWARVDGEGHREFRKSFGIEIPKTQRLDKSAEAALRELASNVAPAGRRLALLEGALPFMKALRSGRRLYVNIDDWINKSSGRKDVSLGEYKTVQRKAGNYSYSQKEFTKIAEFFTMGFATPADLVSRQFPWARGVPDDEQEPSEYAVNDDYLAETGAWDSEDGVYIDVQGEFDEYFERALERWRQGYIGEFSGEVARYRLELKLNSIGRSFLRVHRYLHRGPTPAPSDD